MQKAEFLSIPTRRPLLHVFLSFLPSRLFRPKSSDVLSDKGTKRGNYAVSFTPTAQWCPTPTAVAPAPPHHQDLQLLT